MKSAPVVEEFVELKMTINTTSAYMAIRWED